jgi:hypothetical protein
VRCVLGAEGAIDAISAGICAEGVLVVALDAGRSG